MSAVRGVIDALQDAYNHTVSKHFALPVPGQKSSGGIKWAQSRAPPGSIPVPSHLLSNTLEVPKNINPKQFDTPGNVLLPPRGNVYK